MNFHCQLHIITIMQKILYVSQFTNMSGKLHTSGVDTGHLSIYTYAYSHSCWHIVHNCLWINSIFNSKRSIQSLMYLYTLTRYLLHTHTIMLDLTLSFCKLSRVILLNHHIRFKFSLYVNKIKILAQRKCYKRGYFDS